MSMKYYFKNKFFFAAVSAMVLWACESSSASKPEAEEADVEIIRFDASEVQTDSFVDYRDDHKYYTVTIGEQTWMAENLSYKFSDSTASSYCYNDNDAACRKYGRLYSWSSSMVRGVCPSGWRFPDNEDWKTLIKAVGDVDFAGRYLKSRSDWDNDGAGLDDYGFAVLPAGYRNIKDLYTGGGSVAAFWSATAYDSTNVLYWSFNEVNEHAVRNYDGKKMAASVRCIKGLKITSDNSSSSSNAKSSSSAQSSSSFMPEDVSKSLLKYDPALVEYDSVKDPRDGRVYKTVTIDGETWLAENLKYKTSLISESTCYPNADTCEYFGRYYSWSAAKNACPEGWFLPSAQDWRGLLDKLSATSPWGILETVCSTDTMFVGANHGKNVYGLNIGFSPFYESSNASSTNGFNLGKKKARYWVGGGVVGYGTAEFDFVADKLIVWSSNSNSGFYPVRCIKR